MVKLPKLVEINKPTVYKGDVTGDMIVAKYAKNEPRLVKQIKVRSAAQARRRERIREKNIEQARSRIRALTETAAGTALEFEELVFVEKELAKIERREARLVRAAQRATSRLRLRERDQTEARDRQLTSSLELVGLLEQEQKEKAISQLPQTATIKRVIEQATGRRIIPQSKDTKRYYRTRESKGELVEWPEPPLPDFDIKKIMRPGKVIHDLIDGKYWLDNGLCYFRLEVILDILLPEGVFPTQDEEYRVLESIKRAKGAHTTTKLSDGVLREIWCLPNDRTALSPNSI